MAFHEQHERKCPFCAERISGTAPKCFNCGRFVDGRDEDDGEERAGRPRGGWGWGAVLLVALICLGLVAYFNRPPALEDETAKNLHEMMARMAGRPGLNRSSPMMLAEVEPHLRVGMPFQEVERLVGRKNTNPEQSTVIGSGLVEGAYLVYFRDATLFVQTDGERNIASWRSVPADP